MEGGRIVECIIELLRSGTEASRAHAAKVVSNLVAAPPNLPQNAPLRGESAEANQIRAYHAAMRKNRLVAAQVLEALVSNVSRGGPPAAYATMALALVADEEEYRKKVIKLGAIQAISALLSQEGHTLEMLETARKALRVIWPESTSTLLSKIIPQAPSSYGRFPSMPPFHSPSEVPDPLRSIARDLWNRAVHAPLHLNQAYLPPMGPKRSIFIKEVLLRSKVAGAHCVVFFHDASIDTPTEDASVFRGYEEEDVHAKEYWIWKETPSDPLNHRKNESLMQELALYMVDVASVYKMDVSLLYRAGITD